MKNYIYDNSIKGFLSTVFAIYEERDFACNLTPKQSFQPNLTDKVIQIETNEQKALRVKKGIIKKAGINLFNEISTAHFSDQPNKSKIIFNYVKLVFAFGKKARLMLNEPDVINYSALLKKVTYERHRMIGFMRFEETLNGALYAKYSPDHNITELLLGHFANRLSAENFIIHDTKRNILGVYSAKENKFFTYTTNEKLNPVTLSTNENFFQKLWQQYYCNASIKERYNPKLQKQHMPTRYHKYLTELKATINV